MSVTREKTEQAMKLIGKTVSIAALTVAWIATANAGYITTFTAGQTTTVAGATVFDFDSGLSSSYTGGQRFVNSVSGISAAPAGDNTPYYSVAHSTGTFAASVGDSYNYFGLYWGSIDDYNTLSFYSGDTLLASITGSDVISAGSALGDQSATGSNRYVNFFFDAAFNRIDFTSSGYSFESDNHAFATVPEPTTLGLLGIGLLGLGLTRRGKR
jgi:PEP-CTERM motif